MGGMGVAEPHGGHRAAGPVQAVQPAVPLQGTVRQGSGWHQPLAAGTHHGFPPNTLELKAYQPLELHMPPAP